MSDLRFEEEEFSTQFNGQTILRILAQTKAHWPWLLGFLLNIALVSTLDSYFTFLSKRIVDEGIVGANHAALTQIVTTYGLLIVVQAAGVFGFIFLTGILGQRIQYDLRKKMFLGYINMGNHNDEFDNKEIIKEIVNLRLEKANLLGYTTHADYVLEENMAKKPVNVYNLLKKIWKPALNKAKQERDMLQKMADKEGANIKLEPWDWWYYAEKLKKAKYDIDESAVKPYFQLER